MRISDWSADVCSSDLAALRAAFVPVAERFALDWGLVEAAAKPRAIIAVSTGSHCLADLLHRRRSGALSIEIAGVVGNHGSLRALTEWHGLAFQDRKRPRLNSSH